ncbi:DUF6221 family protein [Saccharopolyspora sp. 5N708]|uniref:DUF6221 family protein n=1 Tax=Saccharopolyspora sp. 5N708 TaxID=3457424 RepID=UPI003FCFD20A
MVEDLVAFVKARLIEDRRIAVQASSGAPRPPGQHEDERWEWIHSRTRRPIPLDQRSGSQAWGRASLRTVNVYTQIYTTGGSGHEFRIRDAEVDIDAAMHIARHDPARVLADVAAKLRIVGEYERAVRTAQGPDSDAAAQGEVRALGRVLRQFAHAYADHPDYRPKW